MIINFSIENFGSIKKEQKISFLAENSDFLEEYYIVRKGKYRLLKLLLLYGANASGKTTVLQALDFLRDLVLFPASSKNEKLEYSPFMFDPSTRKAPSKLTLDFIHKDIRFDYKIVFNRHAILREELKYYQPNKATLYRRETDQEKKLTRIEFGSKIKIPAQNIHSLEANTLWNNTVLGGYLKTNITIPELQIATDWFEQYLQPLIKSDDKLEEFVTMEIDEGRIKSKDVIKILKKADFNISSIKIKTKDISWAGGLILDLLKDPDSASAYHISKSLSQKLYKIQLGHKVRDKIFYLPFDLESSGTRRFYGLAGILTLLLKKSVLFPIDELEASIHPDLFNYFILLFLVNSRSSQIISTTHNREILSQTDMIRDDALWITDKNNEDSATEIYSFAHFDTSVIRKSTNRLNLYKSGRIGGIPLTRDLYLDL